MFQNINVDFDEAADFCELDAVWNKVEEGLQNSPFILGDPL